MDFKSRQASGQVQCLVRHGISPLAQQTRCTLVPQDQSIRPPTSSSSGWNSAGSHHLAVEFIQSVGQFLAPLGKNGSHQFD